ncbi:hypothetical protein JCM10908_006417 [Rhodotorula pacifica]|uniref:uncharacterized protein n=1 Tax=Rhodotorula pacifica TaxID=1495444 RepID=UPI00316E55D9
MSNTHKWGRPKAGPVGPTATLSLEQQQILAAVPRYKKAWVRPSSLKPGQNPNFKILKWVIDTDLDKSEGTEEEMREALEQVTAGNVPLPSAEPTPSGAPAAAAATTTAGVAGSDPSAPASAVPSALTTGAATTPASSTPASGGTPAPPAQLPPPTTTSAAAPPAAIPSSTLAAASNPIAQVQGTDPAKPAEGPAPDGTAPSVHEAVKGLEDVEMGKGTDAGPTVAAEAKSLVQEDQVAPQP